MAVAKRISVNDSADIVNAFGKSFEEFFFQVPVTSQLHLIVRGLERMVNDEKSVIVAFPHARTLVLIEIIDHFSRVFNHI